MNVDRARYGFGRSIRRREDARFLQGAGRYLDDLAPEAARMAVVRSPHAHAEIRAIDMAQARAAPGVLAALCFEDWRADGLGVLPSRTNARNTDGSKAACPPRPPLVEDRARYVGDAVAVVVAQTADQARDAAERVCVDYAPAPALTTAAAALEEGAPRIWDAIPGNLACEYECGDAGAVAAALASAAHVVTLALDNQRVVAAPIEPRGYVGRFDPETGRFHLEASSQNLHANRADLAQALGIPADALRLTAPDVGGGFGAKNAIYPEMALTLWAAKRLGRPVKWIADRGEAFLSDAHGRDQQSVASLALDADGAFLALKVESVAPIGAYTMSGGPFTPTLGSARTQGGGYRLPATHFRSRAAFANTAPTDPYRGAGRPEASYLMERLVDEAAARLGVDPAALRRRNLLTPDELPFRNGAGLVIDSGDFPAVLDQALALARHAGFRERAAASERVGKRRGLGVAFYVECTGGPPAETAALRFRPGGAAELRVGLHSTGMGQETTLSQMAAARLGLPIDAVVYRQGDTDALASGGGHGGSRSLETGGAALTRALESAIEKSRPLAGEMLEAAERDLEFGGGVWRVAGSDLAVGFRELLAEAERRGALSTLDAEDGYARGGLSFPNGCHIAEVEVDPATGAIALLDFVAVEDVGPLLNPMTAEGQIAGGVVQGLGQALIEAIVYDRDGQLLTGSMMDYALPRAVDAPDLRIAFDESQPAPSNLLGVKGAGEAGCCGAPGAVVNAVLDALRPLGVRDLAMPLTPCRVWTAIQAAQRGS